MDDLIGPGPALTRGLGERFDEGTSRTTDPVWVRSLVDSVEARVRAMSIDEASWMDCSDLASSSCAPTRITELGLRIHRRPLAPVQVDGYWKQFHTLAGTSRAEAARAVITSMLLSPAFVFRIEQGDAATIALTIPLPPSSPPEPPTAPNPQLPEGAPLSAYEIAARLSHFILRRAPDEELLEKAARGALLSPTERVAEVDRLLRTSQGRRARVLQHLEWLAIDEARTEPEYVALQEQTSAFIADVLENRSGSFLELLTSWRQPLNLALAQHYGLQVDVGPELTFVDLDPQLYAGVLGQGLWLMRRPTPTQRGQAVLDRLLCSPIPPHPPTLPLGDFTGSTPRERITRATSESAVCAACHQQTDPIGFALEAFDSYGRLTGFDTTGSITLNGESSSVRLAGPTALGTAVATSRDGLYCATRRSVEYLLDRKSEDPTEEVLSSCVLTAFRWGELDLNELARHVAASSAMTRMQRASTLSLAANQETEPLRHAARECEDMSANASGPERTTLAAYCDELAALEAARLPAP